MSKRMLETKVAEAIIEGTDNNWFNPTLVAQHIVTNNPIYTQDKVMDLIVEIIKHQAHRFRRELEEGQTSHGLILANVLNEVIEEQEAYV
jgi:hypothetical protein